MAKKKYLLYLILSFFGGYLGIFLWLGLIAFWKLLQTKYPFHAGAIIFLTGLAGLMVIGSYLIRLINLEIKTGVFCQKKYLSQLQKSYQGTLQALTTALDLRDHGTWRHSARVVGYALAIGEEMGLLPEQLSRLAWGGLLHDIGKIGISDAILLKTSQLTPEEWRIIQEHPRLGADIIGEVEFLQDAVEIVLSHHERYDGGGYPNGLTGTMIPLLSRIFAVADALDAMTSDRPYRPARSVEMALMEIAEQSGKQFCPECVRALLHIGSEQLNRIQETIKFDEAQTAFNKQTIPFRQYLFSE